MSLSRNSFLTVTLATVVWLAVPARAADPDLILYLKLDAASGTAAVDSSGLANNGTVVAGVNGPDWVTGHRGGALLFEGLTSTGARYIQVPWHTSLRVTTGLTVMAWLKLTGTDNDEQTLVGRAESTDWQLELHANDKRIPFSVVVGSSRRTLTATIPGAGLSAGTWYHVAGTYDGSRLRVYLDGVELGNSACTGTVNVSSNASLPLGVGALVEAVGEWEHAFPGTLDEVKIWKRALTAAEIVDEMNAGASFTRLQWRENF